MTRRLLALLLAVALLLAGCDEPQTRRIDGWQGVVDQGWVQP